MLVYVREAEWGFVGEGGEVPFRLEEDDFVLKIM